MKERTKIFTLLASGGILSGLAVSFSKYVGFASLFSMIPLFLALRILTERKELKLRHAYLFGLFYFECFYAVCFHFFFYMYPLEFTGLNKFYSALVVLIACFGLSLLQALFGGLVFVVYALSSRTALAKKSPIVNILSFTAIYTFYEFTQTLGWWGVPWGRLSLALTDLIIPIQTAALFGSYFITALIVLVNALLAHALVHREVLDVRKKYALLAFAVFLSNLALGAVLYAVHKSAAKDGQSVKIGVIQGNYDSAEKWDYISTDMIVDDHLKLTEDAVREGAEIVLWAETSLPFTLYEYGYDSHLISQAAEELGVTIIVGTMTEPDGYLYNTLLCYTPDGLINETRYYKRRLVPFGEYVPMRKIIDATLPFLAEVGVLSDDMTPGKDGSVFELEKTKAGALICFDSIYENLTRDTVKNGAEIILLSTNDSWFSDSSAIYMHNNQARFRAVECGRYIARSANTGLSSFISNTGEILGTLEPLTEGVLCAELVNQTTRTLYSVIGNVFVYLCGAVIPIPFIYEFTNKLKANKALQKR